MIGRRGSFVKSEVISVGANASKGSKVFFMNSSLFLSA